MPDKYTAEGLISILQKGLPLDERPFRSISAELGITEEDAVSMTKQLFEEGKARRFGAVFDSQALGYSGTLCGVGIPPDELERYAAVVSEHSGVTHCYEREHALNLWFTLTAKNNELDAELVKMGERIAPYRIYSLPAIKRFKIQVTFGNTGGPSPAAPAGETEACELQPGDEDIVRLLQGNIPVSAEPYSWAAAELGTTTESLLQDLRRLKEARAIRRICVIMRHRKIGYTANGMCTWNVDPKLVSEAGARLAECPEVTHCYERVVYPVFPFNLFAMVHANSRDAAMEIFEKVSKHAGLSGGQVLFSTREFKKASMIYFAD